MGLFDLMELYDKALDKIIKARIKEDEAAGRKSMLLSELMETIDEVDLGNGMIAKHFHEDGRRKMRFTPKP